MAASAAINFLYGINIAYAQKSDREQALEQRVEYLEERLETVERALRAMSAPTPAARHTEVSRRKTNTQTVGAAEGRQSKVPLAKEALTDSGPSTSDNARPDQPGNTSTAPSSASPVVRPGVSEPGEAPQELNVLRENAVTLKPKGIEISNEVDYLRRESSLQNDRTVLSTTNIRYGILDWLELSALIPVGHSTRTTMTAPFNSVREDVSGFGDLTFQANARVFQQTKNWPGVVVSLGMIAPTGANPYDFTGYTLSGSGASVPNPRNPLADYYSQGAWGIHSNLQFYKTVDPVILFFGFGGDYIFSQEYSGFKVSGFPRYSYNFGLSLALSERTTLGLSVIGSYTSDLKVNGRDVFQSSLEPLSLVCRSFSGS